MLRSMIVLGAICAAGAMTFVCGADSAAAGEPGVTTSVHEQIAPSAEEVKPCARTEFKSALVKDACKAGGQKAAKKAMQKFMKAAKKANEGTKITCKSCHTKPGGDFPLTADGLALFKKYGGK
jgi:hypothetical protein